MPAPSETCTPGSEQEIDLVRHTFESMHPSPLTSSSFNKSVLNASMECDGELAVLEVSVRQGVRKLRRCPSGLSGLLQKAVAPSDKG